MSNNDDKHQPKELMGSFPAMIGNLHPEGQSDEDGKANKGQDPNVLAPKIEVPLRLIKPHGPKEGGNIRQSVHGDEYRMKQDQEKRPSAETFMDLIDFIQSAEEALQEAPARGQHNGAAHQHRGA
jgi:hypothetical protein